MAHQPSAAPVDNLDPHHDIRHAGHVIVQPRTLVAVLAALLVFTVLTVAASRAEVWAAETFHIVIPNIVNVGVALSIAIVKATLVALFFMQLKYDNPLNSIIFLFCLFAFGLFLFFSMTDLASRGVLYAYKAGEIHPGGLGIDTTVKNEKGEVIRGIATGVDASGQPQGIVAWARQRRIDQIGEQIAMGTLEAHGKTPEEIYWEQYAIFNHGHHAETEPPLSDANHTVLRRGPTPGLYAPHEAAPAHGEHGH